jgi:hypothetical protein
MVDRENENYEDEMRQKWFSILLDFH